MYSLVHPCLNSGLLLLLLSPSLFFYTLTNLLTNERSIHIQDVEWRELRIARLIYSHPNWDPVFTVRPYMGGTPYPLFVSGHMTMELDFDWLPICVYNRSVKRSRSRCESCLLGLRLLWKERESSWESGKRIIQTKFVGRKNNIMRGTKPSDGTNWTDGEKRIPRKWGFKDVNIENGKLRLGDSEPGRGEKKKHLQGNPAATIQTKWFYSRHVCNWSISEKPRGNPQRTKWFYSWHLWNWSISEKPRGNPQRTHRTWMTLIQTKY